MPLYSQGLGRSKMDLLKMKKVSLGLRGEKIIIVSLLMILASEIGKVIWPMAATDSESANAIKQYLLEKNSLKNILIDKVELYGYFLLTMSLLASGIRCLRNKWSSVKGILLTIVGLAICLFHLAQIEAYKEIGRTLDAIRPPNYEIIKFRVEQENLPLVARSKWSKMYAKDKYLHEGKEVEYYSESGESKIYEPTADDIKFRDVTKNAKDIWACNNQSLPTLFKWWVAVGLVSFALGVFTPIAKQQWTQNK
jgi:hypothetical protein